MRHPLITAQFKGNTHPLNEERIDLEGKQHAARFGLHWNDETRFVEVTDSKKPGRVFEIPAENCSCIVRAPRPTAPSRKADKGGE